MIMKNRFFAFFLAVSALVLAFSLLTACQSKEEKVISQLESLCKTVEKDSFSIKDMEPVQAKFDEVSQAAKECNFTDEQLKEVARLNARFTKDMAKKAVERAGNVIDGVLEGLSGDKE